MPPGSGGGLLKLRVLDIFSGLGGFSLGLERAGMETVAFCEIDPLCQAILKKHWPDIPIYPDITKLTGAEIYANHGRIDCIAGGFPCQSVSVAGRKDGFANKEKSGLWYEYRRLIAEVRPRWIIIENVRNLLNIGFAEVLQDLSDLGLDAEWEVISASSVGAPHLRERLWIVAYPHGDGLRDRREWGPEGKTEASPLPPDDGPEKCLANTDNSGCGKQRGALTIPTKPLSPSQCGGVSQLADANLLGRQESCEPQPLRPGQTTPISAPKCCGGGAIPNTHLPGLWEAFATPEEKSQWWAEATASFRNRWEIEPPVCRVANGLPPGLDKLRRERIRALGNSLVPQIAELIGRQIIKTTEVCK